MRNVSRLTFLSFEGLVLLAFVLFAMPGSVSAGMITWTSPDGAISIAYHFPDDYNSCSPSDTVYSTGLPQNWIIMGQYSFWDLRVFPPLRLSPYNNQTSIGTDLQQQIIYPATDTWPVLDPQTGARSIWVGALAVVFDQDGNPVAQLSNGQKWMVTCTPPPEIQACSPGYWKNHPDSWIGYSPDDDFDTTFGVDYFNPDISLMDAAWLGGGGIKKTARFGVATLLNATHPEIEFSQPPSEVINLVQARDGKTLANLIPEDAVCPIN